jgi:hypothetical protein
MQLTGMLMLSANAIYAILLPKKPLVIPFENQVLDFEYGWSFWVVLVGGGLAMFVGAVVSIFDSLFPNKFSTILEIDYDTPYRYFVGNDAHLFGHSVEKCPHATATATSSTATDTTCCGHHGTESSIKKKPVKKMKSDASTSTVMSIPIKQSLGDIISDATVSSTSSVTMTTRAKIENNNFLSCSPGFSNDAFEEDDCDSLHERSRSSSIEDSHQLHHHHHSHQLRAQKEGQSSSTTRKTSTSSKKGSKVTESNALPTTDEAESDASDVSTTIIDGKRAISLHNFGKFTAQQQNSKNKQQLHHNHQDSSSSSPTSTTTTKTTAINDKSSSSSSSSNHHLHPNRFTTLNFDLNY